MAHCVRIWRHLKMLKWVGWGHDPDDVEATEEGQLAVECLACPHPGRNLPENWDMHHLTYREPFLRSDLTLVY
ncbi:uncharacterized protein LAESUDRAFT_652276 [Laetiporus sulphureus 93-53]|uniref:CxC2-like cysteine cluster KDZ transposase-associated domain-containing protein n=1 Tax=Laetiporus sulphureus 93-53 TaxID=1314785 RepID=A0A165EFH7_9APHY|nr:uncharacterized protein LAESUDRAFT_652276 [Laetiporus sulphureus 93-53]KZT06946.1 hypothetical protein LAESUDRAFT_652276 [Laetiporus sulphureus 93-53]